MKRGARGLGSALACEQAGAFFGVKESPLKSEGTTSAGLLTASSTFRAIKVGKREVSAKWKRCSSPSGRVRP